MNILAKFFKFMTGILRGTENYIIDFISTFVPYAVPIIPAYLTYDHTITEMQFPVWVALTSAFVVEALGLASVVTAIRFWQHNKKYKSEQNRAPLNLAVFVYVFYIVVVIVVNVILEIVAEVRSGWVITAIALFSMLSFPASVLISIRSIHSDILEEREMSKGGGRVTAESYSPRKPKPASAFRAEIVDMLRSEYDKSGRVLAPKEITAKLKLDHDRSKGFVSTLTSQWKKDNNIMGF